MDCVMDVFEYVSLLMLFGIRISSLWFASLTLQFSENLYLSIQFLRNVNVLLSILAEFCSAACAKRLRLKVALVSKMKYELMHV